MDIVHYHFKILQSTNDWIKINSHKLDKNKITLITADQQTCGHGRFNKKWHSPAKDNIYASFYIPLPKDSSRLLNIPQILALAAVKTLEKKGFHIQMKWPNDLMLNNKKIAGILCEINHEKDHINVTAGIGININMSHEDSLKIDQPATSLMIESNKNWDLVEIIDSLKINFVDCLTTFLEKGIHPFLPILEQKLIQKGLTINFNDGKKIWRGEVDSLNSDGSLKIKLIDGTLRSFYSGEINAKS